MRSKFPFLGHTVFLVMHFCYCIAFCGEIYDAASSGDLVKVKALLKGKPSLVFDTDYGHATPLHAAAYEGHKDVAELLLAKGADVNAKNIIGQTPLDLAAGNDHKDIMDLLMAHKADVNIHDAAAGGYMKIVSAMIQQNPALLSSDDIYGNSPLHCAAARGHIDVSALLLANRADVNAKDKGGSTPLHLAARNGHKDVVKLLLANKADVNARDDSGETPLHYATSNDHRDVAELLIVHKADVNAKSIIGWTPLHLAAGKGLKELAELLLAKGADVNAKSNSGETPTHRATHVPQWPKPLPKSDFEETAAFLRLHGGRE
jgi:ankyrin repeat protein